MLINLFLSFNISKKIDIRYKDIRYKNNTRKIFDSFIIDGGNLHG